MTAKVGVIWHAKAHTKAKIEMLETYLSAYFPILGSSFANRDFLYIDGFAGPGEYTNHKTGSPIAAYRAALKSVHGLDSRWIAGKVHCSFIERNRKRYKHLTSKLAGMGQDEKIPFTCYQGTFIARIDKVISDFEERVKADGRQPGSIFAFIDPFGATGVSFACVRNLLENYPSEILLNLDADGLARILRAHKRELDPKRSHLPRKNERHLDGFFGDNDWTELYSIPDFNDQCRFIQVKYEANLRSIPGVKYVYSFAMKSAGGNINYFLTFATKHHKGLEKMKDAMRKIDPSGAYSFTDPVENTAMPGQINMFGETENDQVVSVSPHDLQVHANNLMIKFAGRTVGHDLIRDFVLNYTPYSNPKKLLTLLAKCGKINVERIASHSNSRSFDERIITSITFSDMA